MAQYAGVFNQKDHPDFHKDFMRFFYNKMNKFCFVMIDKKLKDNSNTAAECTMDDFWRWINPAKSVAKNFLAFTKEHNKPPRQTNNNRNSYSNNHGQGKNIQQQKTTTNSKLLSQEHCFYCVSWAQG